MSGGWSEDLLGAPFEARTLSLPDDAGGPVVATLVRRLPAVLDRVHALHDVDVLSVHGWSDYFFEPAIAEFWNRLGARFHALDLRRYGRSLRDGQLPGDVASLDDYDADIAAALEAIGWPHSGRRLVLQGHSTGGLTLALWADRHPGAAAVVLNSPWLEFQAGAIGRRALAPLLEARSRFDPAGAQPNVDLGYYTRAQTELGDLPRTGYREAWRPARGFATHPGWLAAVLDGQRRVDAGLAIQAPVLVLLSAASTPPLRWSEAMTSTDSVLVVDDIARAATRLGPRVTIARIDGAIHDVFLSRPAAREQAFAAVRTWATDGALAR